MLEMCPCATSGNSSEVDMPEPGTTDKGCNCFQSWVDCIHCRDHSPHGKSGKSDPVPIDFWLLLQKGDPSFPSYGEKKPVRISRTRNWINRMLIWCQGSFPLFTQCLLVKPGSLGRINFSPVGIFLDILLHRASQPIDVDHRISLGGEVLAPCPFCPLSTSMSPYKGRMFAGLVRKE